MQFTFFQALCGLFVFDVLRLGHDFARLHRIVRKWKVSSHTATPHIMVEVCDAVNRACVWYPKQAFCLQKSVVTTCLLRSHGIPAQMVLGAQRLPFRAHAWVEVEGRAINEKLDVQAVYGVWERC
jgi:hypothetical protein